MSEKPVIFISHSSQDKELARRVKIGLEKAFKEILHTDMELFVSSSPEAIKIGSNWFNTVMDKLDLAVALIVLITESSINKPWIWFEIGYFWRKQHSKEHIAIYPLYKPGVEIPSPLNVLQAKSMSDEAEVKAAMRDLAEFLVENNVVINPILHLQNLMILADEASLESRAHQKADPRKSEED
jgi:hypothetical protein